MSTFTRTRGILAGLPCWVLVLAGCSGWSTAGPQLQFERTEQNVGEIVMGTLLQTQFRFQNAGTRDLTISSVKPGCYCSAVLTFEGPKPPGHTGSIRVTVDTTKLNGPFRLTLRVLSNDFSHPAQELQIVGRAVPEFTLDGTVVDFGTTARGVPARRPIEIRPTRSAQVVGVEVTDPAVTATLEPTRDGFSVMASIVPSAAEGRHFGILIVRTSSLLRPELRLPIRGRIVAPE